MGVGDCAGFRPWSNVVEACLCLSVRACSSKCRLRFEVY